MGLLPSMIWRNRPASAAPALIRGMNEINRVPAGVPAGGQFAEGRRAESETGTLMHSEPAPIDVEKGESICIDGDGHVYDYVDVYRDHDGELICTPRLTDNLATLDLHPDFAAASIEDKEQYLTERQQVIEDYYRKNFDAEVALRHDEGLCDVSFKPVTFAAGESVTEEDVGNRVWSESSVRAYDAKSFTDWNGSLDNGIGAAVGRYDLTPLPAQPLTISPQRREAIRDQVYEAVLEGADPKPDGSRPDIDDIHLASRESIDERLDAFLDKHSGDIAYLGEQIDYQMTGRSTPADVALAFTGNGKGPGFTDGTDGLCSRVVAQRLDRAAATHHRLRYQDGAGYCWAPDT